MFATEVCPFDLDDLRVPNDAQTRVDFSQRFGSGCLSGTRRTNQQHVVGLIGYRQSVRQPQRADFHLILEFCYGPFDLDQTDLIVEQGASLGE